MKKRIQKEGSNLLIVIILLIIGKEALAQKPVITSFSPSKGKYYDLDTINGTGFHTNVDSNFVFFGTVKANIISASTTMLVVKIPRSAQSGLITVTKGGLTTKSSKSFAVTALGGNFNGDTTVLSYANYIPGATSSSLLMENQLASGDFNLDGEIDIVETNTAAKSRLYLNTKTYQVATSFSSYINLADSTGTKIIGSADLNNDGKFDIISINKTHKKIYYFKNNSTVSTFNLSSPFLFNLQNSPRDFNINDVDGDGKLDLIITFDTVSSGSIGTYIFLNVSTHVDTLLLASPVSIGSNFLGSKIISSDLNLDGKPDFFITPAILYQYPAYNEISIYYNNSTPSIISFSSSPFSYFGQLHLGDYTNDGVNEIGVDNLGGSVQLYKKTLTGFSFQSSISIGGPTDVNKFLDLTLDGESDFLSNNITNNIFRICRKNNNPDPNLFEKYNLLTTINRRIELNSLLLADLDTNYSQDLISFANGLVLTKNNYLKVAPTLASTNVNFLDLKSYKVTVKVTRGNGTKRLVILKKGSPISKLPIDYNIYLAKDSFGLGYALETNNFVMYNGTNDTFNFVNLRRNTRYYAAVIEYNGIDSGANYMDAAYYFNFITPNEMSLQITNLKATEISDSSAKISWVNGDGTNRLIMVSRDYSFNKEKPIKYKKYNANNIYNLGDTLLGQDIVSYIVYADTGSSFYLNGISSSTNYNIRAIEFETRNDSINYLEEIGAINIGFSTLLKMPRIDSLVPIKAQPGEKVIIYGDYFDYDTNKNKLSYLIPNATNITTAVTFGAVKASNFKIINKRTIEAIVPYGASNEFVRVTRKSIGDSYSPKKFQPYFISKDSFGLGSYGVSVSISRGKVDELNGISIADIGGNGIPDYLFGYENTVWFTHGQIYSDYRIDFSRNSFLIFNMNYQSNYNTIETNLDIDKDLNLDGFASSLNGTGSFYGSSSTINGSDVGGISNHPTLGITDFNKDGNYDRLIIKNNNSSFPNSIELGITYTTGSFSSTSFGWSTNDEKITAASINDFNNDGMPDILFASKITGKIKIYRNKYDTGIFSKNSFDTSSMIISSPVGCEKLESADIDGDGREDFVITNSINNKLYLYKNVFNGNVLDSNSFILAAVFSLPCTPKRVRLNDVTGDGKIDIIVVGANILTNGLMVYKNNMVNQNMDTTKFKLYTQNYSTNLGDLKINDVNLDGKPEIILNEYVPSGAFSAYIIVSSTQKLFNIKPLPKTIYAAGDSLYLPFSTFGKDFNSGNIFKVQLLDSVGNIIVNSTIGTKLSILGTDTIPCKIPANLIQGSYKFRIISTSPSDTSVISNYNISVCGSNPNINLTSSKGLNICGNDSLILTAGINAVGNFNWYRNNQLIASNSNNNSIQVQQSGQYRLTHANSLGCSTPSNILQINTFNSSVLAYNYSNNLLFCKNDSVIVKANSSHTNYKTAWYYNNSPIQKDTFANITIKQSGSFYAIIIDSNQCNWVTPVFVVNNNDYKVKVITNKSTTICNGDTTLLFADSLGNSGLKWKWYKNNSLLPDSSNSLKIYAAGIFKVRATNAIGCVEYSNDTQIVVNPKPIANFSINKASQCLLNNNFIFTNTSTNFNNQTWSFGDTTFSSSLNSTKKYSNIGNYIVKLVTNNANNCSDTITKPIYVNSQPVIGVITGNTTPNSITTPFTYSIVSHPSINYNWLVTNGAIQTGQGTNAISVIWNSNGLGTLKTKITTMEGCEDSSIMNVNITSVGINEQEKLFELMVYPNPNKGSFTIKTDAIRATEAKISLVNVLGQEVWNTNQIIPTGINEINLQTNLSAGMYLLRIQNEIGVQTVHNIIVE